MEFPLTVPQSLVASVLVALGSVVQASTGFGLALVAAPLLLLVDVAFVPGPMLIAALALTVLMTHRDRRAVDVRGVSIALIGRLAGTVPAVLAVAVLPEAGFAAVFAILVLLGVLLSAVGMRISPTPANVLIAGTMSGFMGTISSIGGPPIALVYQHSAGDRLRGTLSGFFVVGCILSIAGLAAVDRFGEREVLLGAALIPGVAAGFALSRWTVPLVDQGAIRPLILILSAAAGLIVLLRAAGLS